VCNVGHKGPRTSGPFFISMLYACYIHDASLIKSLSFGESVTFGSVGCLDIVLREQ